MMQKNIGADTAKLAGLQIDMLQKLRAGQLTLTQLEWYLNLTLQKRDELGGFSLPTNFDESRLISEWQTFYQDLFKIETDFSNVIIPEKQKGFDRLLIVAQGMTPQRLYDKSVETFPSWKWTDKNLDEITESDRTAKNGAYAIWVRDRIEADKELKNLSDNQLKKRKITGITLEERLVYEMKYFRETGKHLDRENITLCTGSRYSDGHVSYVGFHPYTGKVNVDWTSPDYRSDSLRSRQAVSA